MRKITKILITLLTIILITTCANTVLAAETENIDNIEINIEIESDGTAKITETWTATIYSGTEMYKPYYDLETSEITNLSVTDETGTTYTYLSSWDISATQEEKTNKCGIYVSGDETDICWGIGEYGSHTYTVTYTITNFVQEYESNGHQQVYFTLIQDGMDPTPEKIKITVYSDFEFTEDEVTVSGYGYSGTATIEDGTAIFETNGSLGSTGYMTIYLKFSENPFDAEIIETSYDDINYIEEEAENQKTTKSWTSYIPYVLIAAIIILIIIYFFIGRRKKYNYNNNYNNDNNNDIYYDSGR